MNLLQISDTVLSSSRKIFLSILFIALRHLVPHIVRLSVHKADMMAHRTFTIFKSALHCFKIKLHFCEKTFLDFEKQKTSLHK